MEGNAKCAMTLLERAIDIAVTYHRGKEDKGGNPYILHPLRMMCRMQTETEMIVAVLHDVVEDTDWTFEMLEAEGFPPVVIEALRCVTKRKGEDYDVFITRSLNNDIARKVKLADLEDNMDIRRIASPTQEDLERIAKYRRAWEYLTKRGM